MSMADRIRDWYEYEKDSNARVMEMFASVPEARRGEENFQTAVNKFAHAIFARKLWLYRFRLQRIAPATLFPEAIQLDQLPESIEGVLSQVGPVYGPARRR